MSDAEDQKLPSVDNDGDKSASYNGLTANQSPQPSLTVSWDGTVVEAKRVSNDNATELTVYQGITKRKLPHINVQIPPSADIDSSLSVDGDSNDPERNRLNGDSGNDVPNAGTNNICGLCTECFISLRRLFCRTE